MVDGKTNSNQVSNVRVVDGNFVSGYKEYKVVHITEGGCGTILLGSSGLPIKKIENEMNKMASQQWQVVYQLIEQKRFWLFWSREAMIITFGR